MALSKQEKEKLLKDFIGNVQKSMLEKLDRVPEDWDGHELREWVGETFYFERTQAMARDKKRLKKYKNDVLVNNL